MLPMDAMYRPGVFIIILGGQEQRSKHPKAGRIIIYQHGERVCKYIFSLFWGGQRWNSQALQAIVGLAGDGAGWTVGAWTVAG